jgi:hypothetical protein
MIRLDGRTLRVTWLHVTLEQATSRTTRVRSATHD